MKKVKLVIGIPSQQHWHADFALSVCGLLAALQKPTEGLIKQYQLLNEKGSILPQLRENLVQHALRLRATHILFLDSDMVFPYEIANEWLKTDYPIVAANCMTKMLPSSPTARLEDPSDWKGRKLYCDPEMGYTQVHRVGTGVMLIDMRVFYKLEQPYFPITWREESKTYQGEDWGFCQKAEAAGFPIYVDQDASQFIGHIGAYTYTHNDVVVEQPPVELPPGMDENRTVKLEIVKR